MLDITTKLSYGVYVVTTWVDGKPTGCIVNSAIQVTATPATFAVSVHRDNYTNECIKKTGKFAVSVLAEDSEPSIIGTFGFKSGRDTDKFEKVGYKVESRLPVITDSCGFIVCDVIDAMESPTHTVFLGEMKGSGMFDSNRKPMTYDYYHKVIKGTSPKTAPTYKETSGEPTEQAEHAEQKPKRKFVCEICGYVYEGDELPDDIICPICGVGKDQFKEIK